MNYPRASKDLEKISESKLWLNPKAAADSTACFFFKEIFEGTCKASLKRYSDAFADQEQNPMGIP
jgi:hypothetical protein